MSKTIDIGPQARKTVKELLQRYLPGLTVWAYGSRVKWTARPESDLDLVVFAGKEQRGDVANLREAFDESNLPFRVDVFIWDEVPEKFQEEIQEGYAVMQERMQSVVSNNTNGLPSSWKLYRLDEVSTIIDSLHKTPGYVPSGYPMVRVTDVKSGFLDLSNTLSVTNKVFKEFTRRYVPKRGDIIFSRVGTYGNVSYVNVDVPFCLGQNTALISPKISPRYLHICLQSATVRRQIEETVAGSTQKTISLKSISALQIPIPPDVELEGITRLITTLDDRVELDRQMNQTLEAIAQAIFKSWFVDFDLVKAKQAAKALGHDPERAAMATLSGKLSVPKNPTDMSVEALVKAEVELGQLGEEEQKQLAQTAALFPDGLVESELGLIPKGWIRSTIGEEVDTVGGGTPSTRNPAFWEEGIFNWVTPKDLSGLPDKVLLSTSRTITEEGLEEISSGLLPTNTVLMSSRAPVGYLALTQIETAINQGFIAMKCNGRLPPRYVLQWANSNIDLIRQMASGSTFAEISKKTFRPFPILVPPAELVEVFENHAYPIYKRIAANAQQSETLGRLRDTLLPRLLSGEIYLGDFADE